MVPRWVQRFKISGAKTGGGGLADERQAGGGLAEQRRAECVRRHGVRAGDHRVRGLKIIQRTAGWPMVIIVVVPSRMTRGTNQPRQFEYDGVDVLMKNIPPAAEQTIPVFHRHGCATAIVVLDRREANEFGYAMKRFDQQRPVLDQGGVSQRRGLESKMESARRFSRLQLPPPRRCP